ncbi:MAG: flagellar biosynthesis protein FlhB [Lachnospiraceae bacterium]
MLFEYYDLQFFAKDGPGGEKTEEPTAKKLEDARKDGQTAKSKDLVTAVSLFALFLLCKVYVGALGNNMLDAFSEFYGLFEKVPSNGQYGMTGSMTSAVLGAVLKDILWMLLPVLIISVAVSVVSNVFQQKWKVTAKPLQPKFSKISPISGFKRIFSTRQLMELIKNIAMFIIIGIVVYQTISKQMFLLFEMYDRTLMDVVSTVGGIVIDLGIQISAIFLIVGFADLIFQKRKFKSDMMMTKQEIKEEFKNTEGDPQVKGQIRRKMQEASRRRMMQALPEADVVITNPTHFAVALKYEPNAGKAPVVIAKGADYLAQQIKEKAKEYDIAIVENKPLARVLYNNIDVGAEIPPELYQAVAEVLAFVFSLKNK